MKQIHQKGTNNILPAMNIATMRILLISLGLCKAMHEELTLLMVTLRRILVQSICDVLEVCLPFSTVCQLTCRLILI